MEKRREGDRGQQRLADLGHSPRQPDVLLRLLCKAKQCSKQAYQSFIESQEINNCLLKKKRNTPRTELRVTSINCSRDHWSFHITAALSLFGITQVPELLSALDAGFPGPGAGTHEWKPALSPLLASYLLWINQGSSPRLSGQLPFTHAHWTGHQSLHSYPKYNFLWSRWQASPQGGRWYQPWNNSPTAVCIFSQLTHFQRSLDHISLWWKTSTNQKGIKQPRK